jgi:hypothetical protein
MVIALRGQTIVINEVLAKVCSVCGEVLLLPETVRSVNTSEQRVTCILAIDGLLHVTENIPARVNLDTGE